MEGSNIRRRLYRLLLCVSLAFTFLLPPFTLKATAQSIVPDFMVNGDTVFFANCHRRQGQLVFNDPSTDSSNYRSGFDGWAVLDYTDRIGWIVASYHLNTNPNTYIDVWDGTTLIENHRSGSGVFNDTIYSGTLRIHVHTASYEGSTPQQLNVMWYADSLSGNCHGLHSLNIHNIGNHSAIVSWNSGVDSVWLDYGNGVHLVQGTSYTVISGLDSATTYSVTACAWRDHDMECCILTDTFTTTLVAPPTCIDVTDLESPFISCTFGNADTPLDSIGLIPGRHTIMTSTTATDPNTDNMVHVVPPGYSSSLRLGNDDVDAEGEGIICQMTVDTNVYDILLLKYAAVLQQPNHMPESQPRFTFRLYDDQMHALDPSCGAADFIASADMDWNSHGIVMWKDWTTVGLNLAPYHGRTINVVFTTRDCIGGEHYGYAYLVTDCFRKGVSPPQCGEYPPSSLTAPPGFLYEWYTSNNPDSVVSTEQTVIVNEPGATYTCQMSYIENPDCKVKMSVFAGARFPLADFDYTIVTSDCVHFNVVFENHSTVSPDGVSPSPVGERCESAWWDFGNGQTSTELSPTATYDTSGTYTVTLISSISGGECQDTMIATITLPTYHIYEEHYTVCDSMTWYQNNTTYYEDTVGPTVIYPAPYGCDTAYILHLNVNYSPLAQVRLDTSCWSTPYSWRDHVIDEVFDTLTVIRLTDTLTNIHGCDSVVGIDVLCVPKYNITFDADADCHIKQYRLVGLSDAPWHVWSSLPIDPALDGHTTDSMLILSPNSITTYTYQAAFTSSGFCPTTKSISLEPVEFPTAQLHLKPEYMTLDAMEYEAIDLGRRDQHRTWIMTEYLDGSPYNTFRPLPEPRVHSTLSGVVDSVLVELDVSNGYCHDTARGAIPLIKTNIFAPNIFTPDKPTNNLFMIIATGVSDVELDIYNREGLLMFHTNDLSIPWDGTHNGRPCVQGAYAWRLRYLADDNRVHHQETIGTVLLIR